MASLTVVLQALGTSIALGACGSLLSLGIGIPMGSLLGSHTSRWRSVWEAVLAWPFSIPTPVAAVAVLPALDALGLAYSIESVIVVCVLLNGPWATLRVMQARAEVSQPSLDVARSLGASRAVRWRWLVWPILRNRVFGAAADIYLECATCFSLVLLLGGGPPVETLDVLLFSLLRSGGVEARQWLTWLFAYALMLSPVVGIYASVGRSTARFSVGSRLRFSEGKSVVASLAVALCVAPWVAAMIPLGDLARVQEAWVSSFLFSAAVAGGVGLTTVFLGLAATLLFPGRWVSASLTVLPILSSIPAMLWAGVGMSVLLPFVDLFSWPKSSVVLFQTVFFFPLALRALLLLRLEEDRSAVAVARVSGASRFQAWCWVEWPRYRPVATSVFFMLSAYSFGDSAIVWLFATREEPAFFTALLARLAGEYRFEDARSLAALGIFSSGVFFVGSRLAAKKGNR